MAPSTAEVSLRLGTSLTVLLCGLVLAGSVAAQTNTQMAQCNGSDPALVILGCTGVIASSQSSPELISLALSNRAVAYETRGQNDRAMADLDEAIKRDPQNPHAWVNRGNLFLAQGQFDRAMADYNQDLVNHPNNAYVFGHRADAYLIHGDPARAVPDYDQAIKLDPKNSKVFRQSRRSLSGSRRRRSRHRRFQSRDRAQCEICARLYQSRPRL